MRNIRIICTYGLELYTDIMEGLHAAAYLTPKLLQRINIIYQSAEVEHNRMGHKLSWFKTTDFIEPMEYLYYVLTPVYSTWHILDNFLQSQDKINPSITVKIYNFRTKQA